MPRFVSTGASWRKRSAGRWWPLSPRKSSFSGFSSSRRWRRQRRAGRSDGERRGSRAAAGSASRTSGGERVAVSSAGAMALVRCWMMPATAPWCFCPVARRTRQSANDGRSAAPRRLLDARGEQAVVGLEQPAVDEQPRRVEQVDDGGDGDGEVAADVVELGRQIDLAGAGQADHLVDVYGPAEPLRDAPGQRACRWRRSPGSRRCRSRSVGRRARR